MRTPACLILTLAVVSPFPQPTPHPPSSFPPSLSQDTVDSIFTNCIHIDITEIEELRSTLDSTVDFDMPGQKDSVPFGLLKEDWIRLKLLQEKLPNNSPLKLKLVRLFRLVISALYQASQNSLKVPVTTRLVNKQANPSLSNTKNNSNIVLNTTTANQRNIFKTTLPASRDYQIDNVAEESELQEAVLPFNTFTPKYEGNSTTTLIYTTDTDILQISQITSIDNLYEARNKVSGLSTSRELSSTLNPFVTEDYQQLNINPGNEHESNPDVTIENKKDQKVDPHGVIFVDEYDSISEPSTEINVVTGSIFESETDPVRGGKPSGGTTVWWESTSTKKYGTSQSESMGIKGKDSLTTTKANKEVTVTSEATSFIKESVESSTYSQFNDGTVYDHETSSQSSSLVFTLATAKDETPNFETGQTTPFDISETSSPNTMDVRPFFDKILTTESTTNEPSSSADDVSKHQHNESNSSNEPYTGNDVLDVDNVRSTTVSRELTTYSTSSVRYPLKYNDTVYNKGTVSSNLPEITDITTDKGSRQDKSLRSSSANYPVSSTPGTTILQRKNGTIHSFNIIFPEYPKSTTPTRVVKKLELYPRDPNKKIVYHVGELKSSQSLQNECQNNRNCVKVQHTEFNNPHKSGRHFKPNGFTDDDTRTNSIAANTNHKSGRLDKILWWDKIRNLRKKGLTRER